MTNGSLPGNDPQLWPTTSMAEIRRFFRRLGKRVVYFAGYGELGYEDPYVVERTVRTVLAQRSPGSVIVHGGTLLRVGGEDGIAAVFQIAKGLGYETSAIHPSVAKRFRTTHRVSPFCDHAFFVRDASWGGLSPSGRHSRTLQAHLDVSDEIVVVGGGQHAAAELKAFSDRGRDVHYVPANMNSEAAEEWCQRAGIELLNREGAAYEVWRLLNRPRKQ